jgi:hypothetical protein
MSPENARYYLIQLTRRYQLIRWTEAILFALAGGLIAFTFCRFIFTGIFAVLIVSLLISVSILIAQSIYVGLFQITTSILAHHLNKEYNSLQESADLIMRKEDSLTLLQQIQQSKIAGQFEQLKGRIKFPNRLRWAFASMIFCVFISAGVPLIPRPQKSAILTTISSDRHSQKKLHDSFPELKKSTIAITPPTYTNRRSEVTSDFHLTVIEGSMVTWNIEFTQPVDDASFILSGNDSVRLTTSNHETWSLKKQIVTPGFYQIQWTDPGHHIRNSDFFKIEIIKDLPPEIAVEAPAAVTERPYTKNMALTVRASLSDDYGLLDAVIIATVAKGSGESVKFREEKIRFTTPLTIYGTHLVAERSLSLNKLGMLPGDELYFYIEAIDNKVPVPSHARTETFFITIKDTVRDHGTFATEMGVDVMPEYFRSQRQIIIDSEKLLEEQKRKKVSIVDFKNRSNDLGADQKALRLRYGQFMGEEHESGGNDLSAFIHDHDSGDETSYFEQSVKAKLKAALALMWDSELHLRLADPFRSLPFQYKILTLLKEISNDSRVYVRRTGFDPPPVKEEKRLKGDLADISNSTLYVHSQNTALYPTVEKALPILEVLLQADTIRLSADQRKLFQQAGNELAGAILVQPGINLRSLTLLRSLIQADRPYTDEKSTLLEIRKAFWEILPPQIPSPTQHQTTLHRLDQYFIKNLEGSIK